MSRIIMVYDGKNASDLPKDELIRAILCHYKVSLEESHLLAMGEAFRCGFLRGEEYANSINKSSDDNHCRYCNEPNGSKDPDVLCADCKEAFGHAFFSEL